MTRIVQPDVHAWCERDVTEAGLLVDADDYFRAFYEAALGAKRSILVSGWQFDSDVALLRGEDAARAELPVTLKAFFNALCERTPGLEIHMLAWDFHVAFALERQWMQTLILDWTTHERLQFEFDSSHVDRGCHHQKFAVIDGSISFLGGLDLCDHRWDTRAHRDDEPLRVSRGEPHKPFHDIQAYLVGRDVGAALEELFACRWKLAGGDPPFTPRPRGEAPAAYRPRGAHALPVRRVALSRTDPRGSPSDAPAGEEEPVHEVVDLYLAAIAAAERSIYIETQYFSSERIGAALVERLRAPGRSALDVVLVLNMKAETMKEQIAVGLAQAKVLKEIREAAAATAHQVGIYYTVPASKDGVEPERATYIHSKLMIIDDRFLNVGSANLTNRSTSVDTELNATFETDDEGELRESIRRFRLSLLAEHLGETGRPLSPDQGTVRSLDARAHARAGRLRLHPSPTPSERKVLDVLDPQALPFDPHAIEEDEEDRSLFARGIGSLWRHLFSPRDDRK